MCRKHDFQADGEWMDPDRFPLRMDGTVRFDVDVNGLETTNRLAGSLVGGLIDQK